jgi:hypothetical protein
MTTYFLESIPVDIATRIAPEIPYPAEYSHIYTKDIVQKEGLSTVFIKIPYVNTLCWTQYKFAWQGEESIQHSVIFRKSEETINLTLATSTKRGKWYSFKWPLPSFRLDGEDGFYIQIDFPELSTDSFFLRTNILGFENLLPTFKDEYFLCYPDRNALLQFTPSKRENEPTVVNKWNGPFHDVAFRYPIYPTEYYLNRA